MRIFFLGMAAGMALSAFGAEYRFHWGDALDRTPAGFRSTVAGEGDPGQWKVVLEDVPPALAPLTPQAAPVTKRAVLAQVAGEPINNHFPILILTNEVFADFDFTTRFKVVSGTGAQMAGVVFRYQDEKNYYVLAASCLDGRFWFFKMVNGKRGPLIGPEVSIPRGTWHEMSVQCAGNQIHCLLDGKEVIPALADDSFSKGRVGFWTKSDSVSYFADARITYARRGMLAQTLVDEAIAAYPRLEGLKIYAVADGKPLAVVASKDKQDLGQRGGKTEEDVISHGRSYFGKGKHTAVVTAPLRDRNGDPIAAVCVILKSFPGQTEDNALARSQPVVQSIQSRVQSLEELLQ